jgi:dipeptidyl aminopeptidase/acylaminoacyl peptidase
VNREVATLEGAVDYLDQTGLIDRDHVGVIGFSRTCLFVKYLLTHSHYYFAAASVQDGIDAGYWQYLGTGTSFTFIWTSDEDMNGGMPFGEGLKSWIERSPSFSIQNVRTPVRIVAPNPDSLLYEWEWFAALSRLGKPVELVYMQDGEHILQRPWERRIAQQGNVDWFCFWLKSEEDPDPAKAEQYARWRKLREQQERARDDTDNSLPLRSAGSTHTRGDAIHGLGPH